MTFQFLNLPAEVLTLLDDKEVIRCNLICSLSITVASVIASLKQNGRDPH